MTSGLEKTLGKHRDGQSLVEFALVLPLLILIVAGMFDLGRAFFSLITITNAAREGARTGTLNSKNSQKICNAAHDEALTSNINILYNRINIICGNSNITCQDPAVGTAAVVCPEDQPIIVKVGYNYNEMFFRFFFPTGIDMTRQAEMLVP